MDQERTLTHQQTRHTAEEILDTHRYGVGEIVRAIRHTYAPVIQRLNTLEDRTRQLEDTIRMLLKNQQEK